MHTWNVGRHSRLDEDVEKNAVPKYEYCPDKIWY